MEIIGDRRQLDPLPGGGWRYTFRDDGVRVEFRYLRREHRQLHAECAVLCDWAGVRHHQGAISRADLNLSSLTARNSLATFCAKQANTKDDEATFHWRNNLHAACIETIAAEDRRQHVPAIVLDDADDITDADIEIVDGWRVPIDSRSMLIAPGDSMKSILLLLAAGNIALTGKPTLFLDLEWAGGRHKRRKHRVFGPERIPTLHYLKLSAPLETAAEAIRRVVDEQHIEFIVGDSVAPACNGPLKDDDVALRFHRALDELPPSLWAAHVPKAAIGTDAKDAVGPFGSVFFANLCRMTWQVRKIVGANPNIPTVCLLPQKQNDGARVEPVAIEFDLTNFAISYRTVAAADVEEIAGKVPLHLRIQHALQRGPQSFAELAKALDAKVDSVIKAANRSTAFTKVLSPDGIQRLALVEKRRAS
jgi:hypothetical protein